MAESMKTQLVSAIYLQELELQEKPSNSEQESSNKDNGESVRLPLICLYKCKSVWSLYIYIKRQMCFCDNAASTPTYTVEEAVETIGFGRFHIMLFLIMGASNVRIKLIFI